MVSMVTRTLLLAAVMAMMTDAGRPAVNAGDTASVTQDCQQPLGMQSKEIPDEAVTASSAFDEKSVGPLNSRIRTERNGGAWCPKAQISKDVYEYLKLDLGEVKVITMVETQGRYGQGHGLEYAPHYIIDYQREDQSPWVRYRNHQRQSIIKGNNDTSTAVTRVLRPPIIARRVRIVPYSVYLRTICLRVEFYGCKGQGVVSYLMAQGESRGAGIDFFDRSYDGKEEDGYLSGGLGQLTDYTFGESSFRLDPLRTGFKGYGWVGWKNETTDSKPVEILFRFDEVQEFLAIQLHCNNQFDKGIRVFRMAEVYFSVGGEYFTSDPVQYDYYRDSVMPHARNVTIPIPERVGQYVKLVLHYDAKWLMISEVTFESVSVQGGVSKEAPPTEPASTSITSTTHATTRATPGEPRPKQHDPFTPEPESPSHKTEENTPEERPTEYHPGFDYFDPNYDRIPHDMLDKSHHYVSHLDDAYIGIIIGTISALTLLICGVMVVFLFRRRRKSFSNGSIKVFGTNIDNLTYGMASTKLANGNIYNALATKQEVGKENGATLYKLTNSDLLINTPESKEHYKPQPPKSFDGSEKLQNEGTVERPPLSLTSPLVVSLPPEPVYHSEPPNVQGTDPLGLPPGVPMATNIQGTGIQGLCGNSLYIVQNAEGAWPDKENVLEFPRRALQFVEKLGQGTFGEIHLCDVQKSFDSVDEAVDKRMVSKPIHVAVKILNPAANSQSRESFTQEIRILSRLKDPNLVHVLGVCTEGEPLAVVLEYTKYGDLHQFLLKRTLDSSPIVEDRNLKLLSYGSLIYMATQIASGMKYLETLNMVHRDLAARNCLVGDLYRIKISDFGMSRSVYSPDYYRMEKTILPIRWMAWESVLLGKFSCKSDVWSFAVTMWEILTFARHSPFSDLSDDRIWENCSHYYHGNGHQVELPQPSNCPKEIYDLMSECWNRDESMRPTFREINMFLSRMNMGYDPREERPQLSNGHCV